jgi:DNA-binding NarL/FixJ family response regulator
MTRTQPIRVAIADDHPVFRAGLRTVVEESPILEYVGEASNGEEAIAVAAGQQPDVLLMDIHMPGTSGIDATRRVLAERPGLGVLMLTMLEDDTSVFAAMRAGARGYLLKGAAPDDIVRAITAVAAGEAIFSPALAGRMAHFFTAGRAGEPHPFPALSARERDILDLIAAGQSNSDIAARLALSEKTVRNNVSAILAKLRVADRSAAIVQARQAGLGADPDPSGAERAG